MPRVHEEAGFTFYIYTRDHRPPHVHALTADGVVVILLGDK